MNLTRFFYELTERSAHFIIAIVTRSSEILLTFQSEKTDRALMLLHTRVYIRSLHLSPDHFPIINHDGVKVKKERKNLYRACTRNSR